MQTIDQQSVKNGNSYFARFLKRYTGEIEVYPNLGGRSANCKTTTMKIGDTSFFLKFQVDPNADDLLVDDINGYILNVVSSKIDDSLTENIFFSIYVDSFLTAVSGNRFDISESLRSQSCSIKTNVQLAERITAWDWTDLGRYSNSLLGLFKELQRLGNLYGMVHNDAHLNNIVTNGSGIKMIDYGRVYWGSRPQIDISDIYLKNNQSINTLDRFIKDRNSEDNIFIKPNSLAPYYMFDVSTIVMNLLSKMWQHAAATNSSTMLRYINELTGSRIDFLIDRGCVRQVYFRESTPHYIPNYNSDIKDWINAGINLFVAYCKECNKTYPCIYDMPGWSGCIDFEKLVNGSIFYWFFQYFDTTFIHSIVNNFTVGTPQEQAVQGPILRNVKMVNARPGRPTSAIVRPNNVSMVNRMARAVVAGIFSGETSTYDPNQNLRPNAKIVELQLMIEPATQEKDYQKSASGLVHWLEKTMRSRATGLSGGEVGSFVHRPVSVWRSHMLTKNLTNSIRNRGKLMSNNSARQMTPNQAPRVQMPIDKEILRYYESVNNAIDNTAPEMKPPKLSKDAANMLRAMVFGKR